MKVVRLGEASGVTEGRGRGEPIRRRLRQRLPDGMIDRRRELGPNRSQRRTGSSAWRARIACALGPENGGLPANISYTTHPNP